MLANELLVDGFGRIKEVVHDVLEDMNSEELSVRPTPEANTIGWLVWHLARVQDNHVAELSGKEEAWLQGWFQQFDLPFDPKETGYGHDSNHVAAVQTEPMLLLNYFDEVHAATIDFVRNLKETDYSKIIDERWDPPVTLGMRLVSVISDDLQHAGQAAYIKGLLKDLP